MHDIEAVGGNRSKSIQKILFKNSTTRYDNYFSQRNTNVSIIIRSIFGIKRDIDIFSMSALNRQIRTFDRVSSQVFEEIFSRIV